MAVRARKDAGKASEPVQTIKPGGVFISHVHEDEPLAEAFALLINDMSAGTIPTYRSTAKKIGEGIQYGEEWFRWICESVEKAQHIVALITPASVGRPWILFEAGLGKTKPSTSVFGVGLGISREDAYNGPFAVLQNCGGTEQELVKLCQELVVGTSAKPREEMIVQVVTEFQKKVDAHFSTAKAPKKQNEDPVTVAVFQALEEMKLILRDQSKEFEGSEYRRWSRRLDFDSDKYDYLLHSSKIQPGVKIAFLSAAAIQLGHLWISPIIDYLMNMGKTEAPNTRGYLHEVVHSMFRGFEPGMRGEHRILRELEGVMHEYIDKQEPARSRKSIPISLPEIEARP